MSTPTKDGFGLDKKSRLESEIPADDAPPPLEPEFPYVMIPLDPEFFEIS